MRADASPRKAQPRGELVFPQAPSPPRGRGAARGQAAVPARADASGRPRSRGIAPHRGAGARRNGPFTKAAGPAYGGGDPPQGRGATSASARLARGAESPPPGSDRRSPSAACHGRPPARRPLTAPQRPPTLGARDSPLLPFPPRTCSSRRAGGSERRAPPPAGSMAARANFQEHVSPE